MCIKPGAAFQARKLQSCWRMVEAQEAKQRARYSHVMRLRPDLVLPPALARHINSMVAEARATGAAAAADATGAAAADDASAVGEGSEADGGRRRGRGRRRHRFPYRMPTHGWGDEICLRQHPGSGAMCPAEGHARRPDPSALGAQCTPLSRGCARWVVCRCQVKCDDDDRESPIDLLTLPPFTPLLRNDTFVDDGATHATHSSPCHPCAVHD